MRRLPAPVAVVLWCTLLGACLPAPRASVPLRTLAPAGEQLPRQDTLLVMLPGLGDRVEAFSDNAFLDIAAGQPFDVLATDAHFGYYRAHSLIERLHQDVIEPARARGYRKIWLLGISLGGYGALLYAGRHPQQVQGVVLLAPYLGERSLLRTIREAGGLARWSGRAEEESEHEVAIWQWLREPPVPVFLGYGADDRFAADYQLLRPLAQATRQTVLEGGHNWATWRELWQRLAPRVARPP